MLINDSTLVYNNNKNINMPKIKKNCYLEETRDEKKIQKKIFRHTN